MRTATRVLQSIGRIFRSNTDHGAVVICGTKLQQWLLDPKNQAFFPPLIQRQLQLGLELRTAVDDGRTTFEDLLAGVLTGSRDWDRIYKNCIEEFDTTAAPVPPEWLLSSAVGEQAAYQRLWEGDYTTAATLYGKLADSAMPHEERLAAWYRHWEARCLERLQDTKGALRAYTQAANIRSELGRPKISPEIGIASAGAPEPSSQAIRIAEIVDKRSTKIRSQIQSIKDRLKNGPDTKPAEAAMAELGDLLGLETRRPDTAAEAGTGPDVIWRHAEMKTGVVLELKTDKKANSMYTKKDDIGQFQDHVNFIAKEYPKEKFRLRIVGPRIPVSEQCNPPDDLRITEVEQFHALADRVETFYQVIIEGIGETKAVIAQRWMDHFGMTWPHVIDALESDLASDLQSAASETP